ncbi:helix-turn-helix transcriptional regulator [Pollutimonas sp. H1-120]|uniref:helix-turn-helix domain-containing protein n=1 Tax=Pollutimonas sp. H1-120 TaxID=3148824 RepID=UPI003B51F85B
MTHIPSPVGEHLRLWRQRRRLSQLDLACNAEISTRHLSFIETGRSLPSREMLLRLAEQLDVPLRARNELMLAAGYAPHFAEHALADPAMGDALMAIERLLAAHEPFPALAVDRHWNMLHANKTVALLLEGVAPGLLEFPVNVLRLSLHPEGLAPRILNLAEWRAHLLHRLLRQYEQTADPYLADLLAELRGYPVPCADALPADANAIAVPLRLQTGEGVLSLLSATMIFGTPLDVTLSELALETFLPADGATAALLRRLAPGHS